MAKKLGKALLFTTAIGLAAAAAYVYFKKKNDMYFTDMDEDFDDTFEDDVDSEESRSYVELPKEAAPSLRYPRRPCSAQWGWEPVHWLFGKSYDATLSVNFFDLIKIIAHSVQEYNSHFPQDILPAHGLSFPVLSP